MITVADPAVRFHNLIVAPNQADLEIRRSKAVWQRSQDTFTAKILGPHFEHLAREWTRWHADEAGIEVGAVGSTHVACPEHQGHEIDVVALDRESTPRNQAARIVLLGKAKATAELPGRAELDRLVHVRDILVAQGRNAADARLALFSLHGFRPDAQAATTAPDDPLLVDLPTLYGPDR